MIVAYLGGNPQRCGAVDSFCVGQTTSRQQQRQNSAVTVLGSNEHGRRTVLIYTLRLVFILFMVMGELVKLLVPSYEH